MLWSWRGLSGLRWAWRNGRGAQDIRPYSYSKGNSPRRASLPSPRLLMPCAGVCAAHPQVMSKVEGWGRNLGWEPAPWLPSWVDTWVLPTWPGLALWGHPGGRGAGSVHYWPVDLQGRSGQVMRPDTQRGCGHFLGPQSVQMGTFLPLPGPREAALAWASLAQRSPCR